MIGFDQSVLEESGPGDTRERHIKYADALRQRYAKGRITMVIRVPRAASDKPMKISEGLIVYRVPSPRLTFLFYAWPVLKQIVQRDRPDVVTSQTPFDDGILALLLRRKYHIPYHLQIRSSFFDVPQWVGQRRIFNNALNQIGKYVAKHADTIRCVSGGEKRRMEARFAWAAGKTFALHPLVNTSTFETPVTTKEAETIRVELQRYGENLEVVLYVGRLATEKNVETLLRAFAIVHDEFDRALLVIAGDGPLRSELGRLARQLGIDSHVVWLGARSLLQLRPWYDLATVAVLPSFQEGLAKVVVEAYLMATPVIATPFVSAGELIRPGNTGWILNRFTDSRELAAALRIALANPAATAKMGERGRQHIRTYLQREPEYFDNLIEMWRHTAGTAAGVETERMATPSIVRKP